MLLHPAYHGEDRSNGDHWDAAVVTDWRRKFKLDVTDGTTLHSPNTHRRKREIRWESSDRTNLLFDNGTPLQLTLPLPAQHKPTNPHPPSPSCTDLMNFFRSVRAISDG